MMKLLGLLPVIAFFVVVVVVVSVIAAVVVEFVVVVAVVFEVLEKTSSVKPLSREKIHFLEPSRQQLHMPPMESMTLA